MLQHGHAGQVPGGVCRCHGLRETRHTRKQWQKQPRIGSAGLIGPRKDNLLWFQGPIVCSHVQIHASLAPFAAPNLHCDQPKAAGQVVQVTTVISQCLLHAWIHPGLLWPFSWCQTELSAVLLAAAVQGQPGGGSRSFQVLTAAQIAPTGHGCKLLDFHPAVSRDGLKYPMWLIQGDSAVWHGGVAADTCWGFVKFVLSKHTGNG